MILMVFDLGDGRQLMIPATNFLSICDDGDGGSLIKYNLDDVDKIEWKQSKVAAKDAMISHCIIGPPR